MSIELMERALEFITGVYFGEHEGSRADREKLEADLTTAIQQVEAQQPSSKEHLFELWWEAHMPNATQEQAWTAFTAAVASNGVGIAAQHPAKGEPVAGEWFCGNCRVPVPSPASHPAPSVPDDRKRLDYLQDRGATIDLIAGVADFYPMRFRVGGLHSSANIDVRAAIDAAMLAAKQEGGAK